MKNWKPEDMDNLDERVVELTTQVRGLMESNRTLAERAGILESANADLVERLEARDAEDAAHATGRALQTDGERAIAKAYMVDPATAKGVAIGGATKDRPIQAAKGADVAIRMYGQVTKTGEYLPGLMDDDPKSDWQLRAQELAETVSMVRAFGIRPTKSAAAFVEHMRRGPEAVAKVFTDESGYGAEVLPEVTTPVLQRAAEMSRRVEALFPTRNVGPGGSHKNPFLGYGSVQFFTRSSPSSSDNDPAIMQTSDLEFETRNLDPVTLAAVLPVDLDAEEDAIIQWAAVARDAMVRARVDAVEDAIINGDAASTHQDSGLATWSAGGRWGTLGSPKDHRKAWTGLRARAADVSCTTDVSSAASAKDWIKQLANLGVAHSYGDTVLMPSSMHFLVSIATDADLWRADGAGADAGVIQGSAYQLWGRPIVLSQFTPNELNASGLYDGTTTSYGCRIAFDRSRFEIVRRRGLRMDVQTYSHKGIRYMTVTDRLIFRTFDGAATKNVHVGYSAPIS